MQAFGAFSPNKMKFYGEKHPHLPIYSAKRERTFEVGRFYTVSVPSKLLIFLVSRKSFEHKIMLTPKFFIAKYIVARKFLCANYGLNTDQIRSIWLVPFCLNFTFTNKKKTQPIAHIR